MSRVRQISKSLVLTNNSKESSYINVPGFSTLRKSVILEFIMFFPNENILIEFVYSIKIIPRGVNPNLMKGRGGGEPPSNIFLQYLIKTVNS